MPFESSNTSGYAKALQAAREAVGPQLHPPSTLYVVATPIGNLADITLRALHVLALADTVACEDTRHTQALLRAYGIDKPAAQLLAVHEHNETQASEELVQRMIQGQRVAYVSDAGTPAVSDPGARLVAAARGGSQAAGGRLEPFLRQQRHPAGAPPLPGCLPEAGRHLSPFFVTHAAFQQPHCRSFSPGSL